MGRVQGARQPADSPPRTAHGRKLRELKAVAEIAAAVSVPGDPAQVYERVARITQSVIGFDRWSIAAYNETGDSFTEVHVLDTRVPGWRGCESYRLRGALAAQIVEDSRVDLLLADLKPSGRVRDDAFPARFPSMVRVPIEFRGRLVGSLTLRSERPRAYNRHDLALAREIGAKMAPTVEYFRLVSKSQVEDERKADDRRGRSVMLATLSEKLRNPLSAARTAASMVTEAAQSRRADAIEPRTIELLNRSIERLNTMVERAFELALVEQYSSPIPFKMANLVDLIVQECALFEQVRKERSIRLELPQEATPVDAYVEPVLFKKCLHELIDNAHRYTPVGGSISVSLLPEDLWILVTIINTGLEIPADELRLVFTPFFRGRAANPQSEGAGLGLSIARGAARLHGGTLSVESSDESVRVCLKVPSAIGRGQPSSGASESGVPFHVSKGR